MATVSSYQTDVTHSRRTVYAKLTSVTTADTFVTGLSNVEFYTATLATAGLSALVVTESSGTLTFAYTGGSGVETLYVMAVGS